jgi:hypothetical protein
VANFWLPATADKVSEERLLGQIKANLEKDLDKKDRIVMTAVQLRDFLKHSPASPDNRPVRCLPCSVALWKH